MTSKRPQKDKYNITLAVCLALLLSAFTASMTVPASGAVPQEYQVKAIFISNMAKFTQWPPGTLSDPGEPFTLYVMGEYRFGSAFGPLMGMLIHDRPLSVKKLEAWEDIPPDCRTLFLGTSDRGEMKRILVKIENRPVLTISDEDGFLTAGGMIELFTAGNKVRFSVNPEAARKSGLTISSRLLKLAVPEGERSR